MSNQNSKVASLKDRVIELLKDISEDAELALAPEIAQVQNGLNTAHKWLENLSGQSPEQPVEIPGGVPVGEPAPEQPPVDNAHVATGAESFTGNPDSGDQHQQPEQ
jgi:hypothetical protein